MKLQKSAEQESTHLGCLVFAPKRKTPRISRLFSPVIGDPTKVSSYHCKYFINKQGGVGEFYKQTTGEWENFINKQRWCGRIL